jgi:hypothetical protein
MSPLNHDPMTVGKILDRSFNFVFKNIIWITILGFLVALPELYYTILQTSEYTLGSPESPPGTFEAAKFKLISYSISMLTAPFLTGTVTILLANHLCGGRIKWYHSLKKCITKIAPLFLLEVLIFLAMLLGFIVLFIPGLIVMSATACAVPAMLLEDLGPRKAFDRSWNLTKGNRLRIYGYSFITGLMMAIPVGEMASFLIADPLYTIGIETLIGAPFKALWPAITTLLYYDLRFRKEAIDLEEEANSLPGATVEIT